MNNKLINYRHFFPSLKNNPEVIYFDSATTTQKPKVVIEAVNDYLLNYCANGDRSTHLWGRKVTKRIQETREKVAKLLNTHPTNIFFTAGATDSSEKVVNLWARENLKKGEILLGKDDHIATTSAWKSLPEIDIKYLDSSFAGDYKLDSVKESLTDKTKVVVLTHLHNVYGIPMGVEEVVKMLPKEVVTVVDASQSMGHIPIDLSRLKVDFLYFSGHKMFALPGIGVLFASDRVKKSFKDVESGSLNIPGIVSLSAAVDFINKIGIEKIEDNISTLTGYLIAKLQEIPGVNFVKGPAVCNCNLGRGIQSFMLKGISSIEVGQILDTENIYVRTGIHCSSNINSEQSIRVSMHVYNTKEDIDKLIKALRKI